MATIPSDDDLGFRSPQAVVQVSRAPRLRTDREAYVPREAIEGMARMGETIANEEFAKAEVQFQIGSMMETQKADADSDIDGVEERYAAAMQDQLGKAAAGITDRRARELFMTRGEEGVARSKSQMNLKTTNKKNDREKGYMVNAVDLMVKGGMDLDYGDPAEAGLGIQMALDSMVERNVISNVEAQGMMRKATFDIAYGRLKAMPPQDQLEVINNPDPKIRQWVSEIPADVVRGLKEEAESQAEDNQAHEFAMLARGQDEAAAMDEMYATAAKENWDVTRIDKTRMRIMRIKQDDELINQRRLEDYYEEGAASIWAGESTLDQIRATPQGREMLKNMTRAQRLNLEAAQDNATMREAGEGRKYSDRVVVDKLKAFMVNGQPVEMRKYWSENYARLNDSDFTYFNQATSPKKSSEASFKPIQSTKQVMDSYLSEHPIDEDGEIRLWRDLKDQASDYFDKHQENPPKALIQTWVQDMHRNVILTPEPGGLKGIFFDGEEYLARDLPPLEKGKYDAIVNVYKQAGIGTDVSTMRFNEWTNEERVGFRELRNSPEFKGMPADLFVKTYETLVQEERAAEAAKPKPEKQRYDRRGRKIDAEGNRM